MRRAETERRRGRLTELAVSLRNGSLPLVVLAFLALPAVVTSLRPAPPEEVAYLAIMALERRDARALYDLGSASERSRAGITPLSVSRYLERTLYKEGDVSGLRVVRQNTVRPNYIQYMIETERLDLRRNRRHILLSVQQLEGEPFTIALGELLWNVIEASYPATGPAMAARVYADLRDETGIRGWYTAADGWRFPE